MRCMARAEPTSDSLLHTLDTLHEVAHTMGLRYVIVHKTVMQPMYIPDHP